MPSSYLATIGDMIPSTTIQSIANQFGAPQQSVVEGIQSSVAAVIGGLSHKSGDTSFLSQFVQKASSSPETGLASALSNGALANPASSFFTSAKQLLSSIFGDRLAGLTQAMSSSSGLGASGATTLLAVGAQLAVTYIGNKLRDGSVTAATLPAFLAKESTALQGMLPAGFTTGTAAVHTHKVEVDPVVAQSVIEEKKKSPLMWLLPLLLFLAALGFWWYHSQQQPAPIATQPASQPVAQPSGTSITSTIGTDLGSLIDVPLTGGATVRIPQLGVESKLLAFIQDPNRTPDKTTWFDFDRLLFATDSTTLEPQSKDQLASVAAILNAYPAVHLTIGGYTDNTGDAAHNLKLSQDRAAAVTTQLTGMGITANRLTPRGYGQEHPVGDNATAEGRAQNRRISMLVTAK